MKRAPLLLALSLIAGLMAVFATSTSATAPRPAATGYQPSLPVNMVTYYPVEASAPSHAHPSRNNDYKDVEAIRKVILDMQYAGQQVGLYSWFGQHSFPDRVMTYHLRAADDTSFRWAIFNENEGGKRNATVASARSDLNYIYAKYAKDPSYFHIGGKPVMFLYGDPDDGCRAAQVWQAADSSHRFFIVNNNVKAFASCPVQPQAWDGYAPANSRFSVASSMMVSPGFYQYGEKGPRLQRNLARFAADLRAMKASKAKFRITTTWNEWSQATSVESAKEWPSSSGHGVYVDQMHSILGSAATTPEAPRVITSTLRVNGVELAWKPSAGAQAYQVFRNGCLAATVTGTYWSDSAVHNASASYFVKAVNRYGTSRRSPVRLATAGFPKAAPRVGASGGMQAMNGQRLLATVNGTGIGCVARQRGQAVFTAPSNVPANATALVLTVHAVSTLGGGGITLYPMGGAVPSLPQLRYYSSRAASNTTVVQIGTARQIVMQESGAATHVLVDVIGYVAAGKPGLVTNAPGGKTFKITSGNPRARAGTVTAVLPSYVPRGVTAVQVRLQVRRAPAAGYATLFAGRTRPSITSMQYAPSVMMTTSVLVPVDGSRVIHLFTSTPATVTLGIEGWTATRSGIARPAVQKILATSSRLRTTTVTMPAASRGHVALIDLGVGSPAGYGALTVTPSGGKTIMAQVNYGPQQPQSGFFWVRVPANGVLKLGSSQSVLMYVDQIAIA